MLQTSDNQHPAPFYRQYDHAAFSAPGYFNVTEQGWPSRLPYAKTGLIESVIEEICPSVEARGPMGLALRTAFAGAIQDGFCVENPLSGSPVLGTDFGILVGPSGVGKSWLLELATAAIKRNDDSQNDDSVFPGGSGGHSNEAFAKCSHRSHRPRRLRGSATANALAKFFSAVPGTSGLQALEESASQFARAARDPEVFCQLNDGIDFSIERSDQLLDIERPKLSLLWAIQLQILLDLLRRRGPVLIASGLLPRASFAEWIRPSTEAPKGLLKGSACAEFDARVTALLNLPRSPKPSSALRDLTMLKLSARSASVYREILSSFKPGSSALPAVHELPEFAARSPHKVLKTALVIHLLRGDEREEIGVQTIEAAFDVEVYHLHEARRILFVDFEDPEVIQDVKRLEFYFVKKLQSGWQFLPSAYVQKSSGIRDELRFRWAMTVLVNQGKIYLFTDHQGILHINIATPYFLVVLANGISRRA